MGRAFWVAPMPPWVTAQATRSSTGPCGTNRSTRALAASASLPGPGGQRGHHGHRRIGQRLERHLDQAVVVLELRRRDSTPGVDVDWGQREQVPAGGLV